MKRRFQNKVLLSLTDDIYKNLLQRTEENGMTISSYVRVVLDQHFKGGYDIISDHWGKYEPKK